MNNLTGATLVDTKRFARFAELDAAARWRGTSRAKIVEEAVNEWLSNYPVPQELWLDDLGHSEEWAMKPVKTHTKGDTAHADQGK